MRFGAIGRIGGLCALLVSMILMGCNANPANRRLAIVWSNIDVSYPVWGALDPVEGGVDVRFRDLISGETRRLHEDGVIFNALQRIPDKPGHFVLASRRGDQWSMLEYDFSTGATRTLFETSLDLGAPFLLGDLACALSPTAKTTKQVYAHRVLCDGTPITEFGIIVTAFYKAVSKNMMAIVDDGKLIVLKKHQKEFSRFDIDIPQAKHNTRFYIINDIIYLFNTTRSLSIDSFYVIDNRVESYIGPETRPLRNITVKGPTNITFVDGEQAIISYKDRDLDIIETHVYDVNSKSISSFTIKIPPSD